MSSGIISRGTIIKFGKFKGQIDSRVQRCKKFKPCHGCEFCKHQCYSPSNLRSCHTSGKDLEIKTKTCSTTDNSTGRLVGKSTDSDCASTSRIVNTETSSISNRSTLYSVAKSEIQEQKSFISDEITPEPYFLDNQLVYHMAKSTIKTRKLEQQNRFYLLLKIWQRSAKLCNNK